MPSVLSDAEAEARSTRRVAALLYDGLCTFEFGIAAEVFGLPRPEMGPDWYTFEAVSLEPGPLQAMGGIVVEASRGLESITDAHTIIIPGWRGKDEPVPPRLSAAICTASAKGARVVSICSGAYVLAAAGLLNGKRATTHWRYAEHFRGLYPQVKLDPAVLYTEDGNTFTSAGSSAGIDVCLHIVRQDYGPEAANSVARRLVMHAHRQGGQTQFIDQPVPVAYEADRLSGVVEFLRENLNRRHTVASLAKHASMSERTFQRRFSALVGMPVGRWITLERIARASDLLGTSDAPLAAISEAVGFESAGRLQYHFRKRFGVSPTQYRERFSTN